eukprot:TRINITY_DN130_c0_g1_i2.p3 TRINITY_DN130_c0_g1~~TRINITY_DN130_c0_g1_i2.p3  ORF type:complete len:119 (-),score=17.70 TRINITY_DN130_c0_g1_i2:696-1052(-)
MKYCILFVCLAFFAAVKAGGGGGGIVVGFDKDHTTNVTQDFLNTWTNLIVNDVVNSIDSRAHLEGNVAEGESDAQAFGDKTKAIGNQWATVVEGQYSGAGGKAIAATCSSSSSACSSV